MMKQLRQFADAVLAALLFVFVLGGLTYYHLKYETDWLGAISMLTVVGGSFVSIIIGNIRGEKERHGMPPIVIPQVWFAVAVFFTLLWIAIKMLNVEIP